MDLFSGAGGLSLGLKKTGINVLWANENDHNAFLTYQNSHPGCNIINDDVNIYFQSILDRDKNLPRTGEVDLLVGGPPCQGFSGFNRFRNINDKRNSMVNIFLNFVEYLKPRYVLIENVPGMLSLNGGVVINEILSFFKRTGYNTQLKILQAGNYGLPQNRWRVFIISNIIGSSIPNIPEATHLFPRTSVFGVSEFKLHIFKPPKEPNLFWQPNPHVTVGDAISDLPVLENGESFDEKSYLSKPKSDYQKYLRRGSKNIYNHFCPKLGDLMYSRCKAIPKKPGAGWLDLPYNLKPKNLLRHGDNRYPNRFGRLHWEGIFNTILTHPFPYWSRIFHPEQNRIISARECARAQGIDDNVLFFGKSTNIYKQIGNAVPPPLAKAIGNEIIKASKM